MKQTKNGGRYLLCIVLCIGSFFYLLPIFIVAMNSLKGRLFISNKPFAWPSVSDGSYVGLINYTQGIEKIDFWNALYHSAYITILSVLIIVLLCAMTGWYITRVKTKATTLLYYLLVFSMVVPFQMVMFTMSKLANVLRLDNPTGILFIYAGFGAGLSTFLFTGFVRAIPIEMEEAAFMDGCNAIQTFFEVILPILQPTAVTVAILNTMWIWNDYLLPYLLLGVHYKTIPIAVQYLRGGYGAVDMGAMMAMLVLAILPIVLVYLFSQRFIIQGVISGAVKG